MIEPIKAFVRPRVIIEHEHHSDLSDDPVLLEELVADLFESGAVEAIELLGPRGIGATSALQHLAFVFGTDLGMKFVDQSGADSVHDPRGLIEFPGPSPMSHVNEKSSVLKCRLSRWGRDEWIEYLLAADRQHCRSVMSRVQYDATIDSLDGNPSLLRQVFDELVADTDLPNVKSALPKIIDRHFMDGPMRRDIMTQMFDAMTFSINGETASHNESSVKLTIEQARLLEVRGIRFCLAEEFVWQVLVREAVSDRFLRPWPRALIKSVAIRVATDPTIQAKLQNWIDSPSRTFSLAVSLLHRSSVGWRWPVNLFGVPLKRVNLEDAILDGADCTTFPLASCLMSGVSLERATLTGVDLQDSVARVAKFDHADLQRTNLTRFQASKASFIGANLSHARGELIRFDSADLSFANLTDVHFIRCDFTNADLVHADIQRARLDQCDFSGSQLNNANLRQATLARANLTAMDLTVADFREASFHGTHMSHCHLEGMQLPETDFSFADLNNAVMTGSLMSRSDFSNASLRGAKLAEVNWESVDLRGADLTGATFHMGSSRSGLVNSDIASLGTRTGFYTDEYNEQGFKVPEEIRKANLRGADLRGAHIDGVDFYLVDLRDSLYDPCQEKHLRRTGAILATRES